MACFLSYNSVCLINVWSLVLGKRVGWSGVQGKRGGESLLIQRIGRSSSSGILTHCSQTEQECRGEGAGGGSHWRGPTRTGSVSPGGKLTVASRKGEANLPANFSSPPWSPPGLAGFPLKQVRVSSAGQRNPISALRREPAPELHECRTVGWRPGDPCH